MSTDNNGCLVRDKLCATFNLKKLNRIWLFCIKIAGLVQPIIFEDCLYCPSNQIKPKKVIFGVQ